MIGRFVTLRTEVNINNPLRRNSWRGYRRWLSWWRMELLEAVLW